MGEDLLQSPWYTSVSHTPSWALLSDSCSGATAVLLLSS